MKKQRVMKFGAIGDAVYYRVACDCTTAECDMHLELESDPQIGYVYLNITKKLMASAHWGYTDKWYYWDYLRVFINKVRMMCRILFSGYIEVHETLMFKESEHIDEFLTALEEGRRYLLELEKGRQDEKSGDNVKT